MIRLASAALFAAGIALAGWWAGYMLFGGVFEILRARDLEAGLDSPQKLALFEYAGTGFGVALGAVAALRWIWPRRTRPIWAIYLLAAIGGLGGFALAQIADIGDLAVNFLRVSKDAYIFISILSWFILLIAGSAIVVTDEMRAVPVARRLLHGAGISALALALLFAGFASTKRAWDSAYNLGDAASGWASIRFPAGTEAMPEVTSITAEMRTRERLLEAAGPAAACVQAALPGQSGGQVRLWAVAPPRRLSQRGRHDPAGDRARRLRHSVYGHALNCGFTPGSDNSGFRA